MEAAGHWLGGLGHEAADCGSLGSPRASAGSLVYRVRVQKTPGLFPAHWCQPTGGQSQVLESGCRSQESQSWFWITGVRGWFLTQLGMGSGVSCCLCCPGTQQGWDPVGPMAAFGLLVCMLGPQAV